MGSEGPGSLSWFCCPFLALSGFFFPHHEAHGRYSSLRILPDAQLRILSLSDKHSRTQSVLVALKGRWANVEIIHLEEN